MEKYTEARKNFEYRMRVGTRPMVYALLRLHGGEYLSQFTEGAWDSYRAGWLAAGEQIYDLRC